MRLPPSEVEFLWEGLVVTLVFVRNLLPKRLPEAMKPEVSEKATRGCAGWNPCGQSTSCTLALCCQCGSVSLLFASFDTSSITRICASIHLMDHFERLGDGSHWLPLISIHFSVCVCQRIAID